MATKTRKKVAKNVSKNRKKAVSKKTNFFSKFFTEIATAFDKWKKEQVIPQIKDTKSLLIYDKQYKYYNPISCFIADDLILTKYNGFLTTFKITNYDLDYYENFEINSKTDMLKSIMKRLPHGYCLHYETQRRKMSKREFVDRPNAPIPTQIATRERFNIINTGETFYKTEQYITLSYCPPNERFKFIKDLFSPEVSSEKKLNSKEEIFDKWFRQQISDFNNQMLTVMSAYAEQLIECKRLNRTEMMSYLYNNINGLQKERTFKPIPLCERVDEYLTVIQPQNQAILKLNGKYAKILTIKAYPEEIETRAFKRLEDLPFEYRMIHRYIPLGKEESIKALKQARTYHSGKLRDKKQMMSAVLTSGSGNGADQNINQKAKEKMDEADALVSEVQEDAFSFGYHTFNIILEDTNRDTLREHTIQIKNIIDAHGFIAMEDSINTLDSFAGCIVGNQSENLRKTTITSDNYVSIMPLSDRLQGKKIHPHFSRNGQIEESLLVTRSMYDLFDFNNHVGDVGHMLCVGRTGGGKSTFLGTVAMNALKYDGCKIIYFDVGGSSIPLNICCGGTVYEFGQSKISLQPLGDVDINDNESMSWATSFIELLIRQQDPKLLGIKTNTAIREALKSLATTPNKEDRTLTNFVSFMQIPEIQEALEIYTNKGIYGSYLDGNSTNISESIFLTFEMEKIIKDNKILMPVLNYLIHKIETEIIATGKPVYLFFDECWLFLKDPTMSAFMANALKTFRKKNTSCIFATQELDDIVNCEIGHVILSQCFTHIYLANDKAVSKDRELYKKMNLNIKEIGTISQAQAKAEYFYKASDDSGKGSGSILFQLKLTPLELAYTGRLNAQYLAVIKKFKEKFKDDIFSINVAWLKFLVKYDREHPKDGVMPLTERDLSNVEPILMRYRDMQLSS